MKTRLAALAVCLFAAAAVADEPFASGLKAGQRPMPYAFLLATGPNRGTTISTLTASTPTASSPTGER